MSAPPSAAALPFRSVPCHSNGVSSGVNMAISACQLGRTEVGQRISTGHLRSPAAFSVAIRTLTLRDDLITLNVGGGVTQDSTEDGEWEEALWKARYVTGLASPG